MGTETYSLAARFPNSRISPAPMLNVQLVSPRDIDRDGLVELVRRRPPLLVEHGEISAGEYLRAVAGGAADRPQARLAERFACAGDERPRLLALLRAAPWESDYFATGIGYFELLAADPDWTGNSAGLCALLEEAISHAREAGIRLLYASVPAQQHALIRILGGSGFAFTCAELAGLFTRRELASIELEPGPAERPDARPYGERDREAVMTIAEELSEDTENRFTLTPSLPQGRSRRYYVDAVKNACAGSYVDDFLVLLTHGRVGGVAAYRRDTALAAACGKQVASWSFFALARSARGARTGGELSQVANRHMICERGLDVIQWKTLLSNRGVTGLLARRQYSLRGGFLYTLHKEL